MLDRDLAKLAASGPDVSLAGLEQAIWSKVDLLTRLRQIERLTSRLQFLAIGVALIASLAIGMKVAGQSGLRSSVMQISSAAADLAPSSLLGPHP
jgi:hypothetical protein